MLLEFRAELLPFLVPGREFGLALLDVQAAERFIGAVVGNVFANTVMFQALFKFGERSHADWADPRFEVFWQVVAGFNRFALFAQVRLWLFRMSNAQVAKSVAAELVTASSWALDELELAMWAGPGFGLSVLNWFGGASVA